MKIYLAAKYSRHPEMRVVRREVEALGHSVTSRWINGNHESLDVVGRTGHNQRFAIEDWTDLKESNLVLWFAEPEKIEGRNRGGRHVEFGLALAWGIRIIVIGRHENVFHYLPELTHLATLNEALYLLGTEVSA